MPVGKLQFGGLNLSMVTGEDDEISIYSTPNVLYDGRIVVAGVTQVGKAPTFSGVFRNRTTADGIISEVGQRHNLTVSDEYFGYGQIISFDFSYWQNDGLDNWYKFTLGFQLENLS